MRIGVNSLPYKIRAFEIAEVHVGVQLTLESLKYDDKSDLKSS